MRWKLPYVVLRPMEMLEDIRMADGTLLVKSMNIYLISFRMKIDKRL